jgi:aspartyl/asparaginyl-tRNA synthetase
MWIRARVYLLRSQGKFAFIVLRRGFHTIQAVIEDQIHSMTREAIKWAGKITN